MILTCPECSARFRLKDQPDYNKIIKLKCTKCGAVSQHRLKMPEGQPGLVIIAHDDFRVVNIIKKLLDKLHCVVESVSEGHDALELITQKKPDIAIIDVALPGIFGFELCERIKNNPFLKQTRVILVASIYDRTRYKRKPQNLYGADDYIEKHHIPDRLVSKVIELSASKIREREQAVPAAAPQVQNETLKDNRELLQRKIEERTVQPGTAPSVASVSPVTPVDTAAEEAKILAERNMIQQHEQEQLNAITQIEERAQKLARLIVSDIALYNQDIISGITISDYAEKLRMDVEDGVKHLAKKIPEMSAAAPSYIHSAFKELIEKRRYM